MPAVMIFLILLFVVAFPASAHDVSGSDKLFVQSVSGNAIFPFMYLGAKHMVTGYDHILFLTGVVFFLRRIKDIVLIVSFFTLGHSATLLAGVMLNMKMNVFVVDAVIGLSVVYKGLENAGIDFRMDRRLIVFAFGLVHGLGLATKLLDLSLPEQGLAVNLLAFNVGVEIGQVIVLFIVVSCINAIRDRSCFARIASSVSILLVVAGMVLVAEQCWYWFLSDIRAL